MGNNLHLMGSEFRFQQKLNKMERERHKQEATEKENDPVCSDRATGQRKPPRGVCLGPPR